MDKKSATTHTAHQEVPGSRCPRCDGMLVRETFLDMTRAYTGLKCLNCGQIVDPNGKSRHAIPEQGAGKAAGKARKKGYFRYAAIAEGASASEAAAAAEGLIAEILTAGVPAGVRAYTVFSRRLNEIGIVVADDEGALDQAGAEHRFEFERTRDVESE